MHKLAAEGETVILRRKGRRTVVFTKDGAFKGSEDGSVKGFGDYLDDVNTW